MSQEYFRCDSEEFCKDATCCRSNSTNPSVTLGDYYRLSKKTGEPMSHIWKTKGDVAIINDKHADNNNVFLGSLGLLHDPCPYLENIKCSVHDSRPIVCASFPHPLFTKNRDYISTEYGGYKCLQGIKLSEKDLRLGNSLKKIMSFEANLELNHFWKPNPPEYKIQKFSDYFRLAQKAIDLQFKRDRSRKSDKTQKLISAVSDMADILKSEKTGIKAEIFKTFLKPVAFSLLEDSVARRMDNLDESVIFMFNMSSEKIKELYNN